MKTNGVEHRDYSNKKQMVPLMDRNEQAQRLLEITKKFITRKNMNCHLITDITARASDGTFKPLILQIVYPKNPDQVKADICMELGDYELNMCEEDFKYYTLTPMMNRFQEFIINKNIINREPYAKSQKERKRGDSINNIS